MFNDIIPSDLFKNPDCLRQGNGTDDIRRTGLFLVRQIRPIRIFQVHNIHCSAADVLGVSFLERLAAANEHADAERGVHFMGRERNIVEMFRIGFHLHVNTAMRYELGGIDHDLRSDVVRPSCVRMNRVDESSDIRCTAHSDQFDVRPVERDFFFEIFFVDACPRKRNYSC